MQTLPHRAMAGVALGSLGAGVYSTVPTVLLLYYCTEILRIAPAVAAAIVLVPKVWAVLWDPAVGSWSDRSRSPHGRRAPFILAGTIGVALTFALLFNAPAGHPHGTVAYVMLVYFLMASAYSLFAVPYVAIPAEISPVAAERERLMTWRMTFAMVGVLVGAGVAPHLVELAGGGRRGYGVMALVVAACCGLAMFVTWLTVRRYHVRDQAPSTPPFALWKGLARIVADAAYVRLWLTYLLALSGASMFLAMVPYYVTRVLGRQEGDAGTALLVLLAGTIVSLPLWERLMRRVGGWAALGASIAAYALVAASFALLPGDGSLLPFFLLGVPFAGLQLVPFTLLAHLTHDAGESSARQEGLYTGVWTAGEKLALALGPAAAGIGLALAGYAPGAGRAPDRLLGALQSLMALGPLVFLLPAIALVVLRRATRRAPQAQA